MKNTSIPYFSILIAAIAFSQSCAESVQPADNRTTVVTSSFSGAEGNCTNGGIKLEISRDGEVLADQTQFICNGNNGANGQDGQKGADGANGQDGQAGLNALVATSDEVGSNCANGGMRIDIGLDANDNGTLDTAEILSTRYICNGANGQDGADGANGQDGQDGQNGSDGKNASIQTTAFNGALGSCTNGGVKVDILIDGVVQTDQTQYICNGANGADGKDGQDGQNGADGANGADGQNGHNALVATSDEVGTNCANGGMRIDIGLDANDNGTLDTAEILSTRYVCNGANGQDGADGANGQDGQNGADGKNASIQTTAFSGAQGSCTNGGVKVDVLVDGVVQAGQTKYICNGANGQDGANGVNGQDGQNGSDGKNASIQTTAFTGTQGNCTNGGVKVDVLINGEVLADQTQYICNGANGADGADGKDGQDGSDGKNASIQTTAFTGAQGTCTNGGVKVEVLIDGMIQASQTQYICNSANGKDGANDFQWLMCYDPSFIVNSMRDSANCGGCGNVCEAGFECVNSTCQRIADLWTSTITCNAQTINPASDNSHCAGCNNPCDAKTCRGGICVIPTVGDRISFGHYEQDNIIENGKESIEWRVLKVEDGKALVISEKALDVEPYNKRHEYQMTWVKSTIRSWLNGYDASKNSSGLDFTINNFIDAAFTEAEKAKIVISNVEAHKNPSYSTSPGNATTDKIFLLSVTEINTYFPDNADALADATPYVIKKGVAHGPKCTSIQCPCVWWLRSPGRESDSAATVEYNGYASSAPDYYDTTAVRPALWVNL